MSCMRHYYAMFLPRKSYVNLNVELICLNRLNVRLKTLLKAYYYCYFDVILCGDVFLLISFPVSNIYIVTQFNCPN